MRSTQIEGDCSEFDSDCFVSLIDNSATIDTDATIDFIDSEDVNNSGLINKIDLDNEPCIGTEPAVGLFVVSMCAVEFWQVNNLKSLPTSSACFK